MLWLAGLMGLLGVGAASLAIFNETGQNTDDDMEEASGATQTSGADGDLLDMLEPVVVQAPSHMEVIVDDLSENMETLPDPLGDDEPKPVPATLDLVSGMEDLPDLFDAPEEAPPQDTDLPPEIGSILAGLTGADTLTRGDAADQINGYDGNDTLDGGAGGDSLFGGAGFDLLRGDAGDDLLHGEADDDRLQGGAGNDTLFGHDGADRLEGGDGADSLQGSAGDDDLHGGAGDDALHGGLDDDTLSGGEGTDTLFGGWGNDVVRGHDDTTGDYLNGGGGNDMIVAGGADTVTGGDGADAILLSPGWGVEVDILDFDATEDRLLMVWDGGAGNAPPAFDLVPDTEIAGTHHVVVGGETVATLHQSEGLRPEDIAVLSPEQATAMGLRLG